MAGQSKSAAEEDTLYFDRPMKVLRERFNHKMEQVGGLEGGLKVRIKEARGHIDFNYITMHLASTLVAVCKLTHRVDHVSEDGYEVHIYLEEIQLRHFTRKYIFVFHDHEAAHLFFCSYSDAMTVNAGNEYRGPSFHDLMYGVSPDSSSSEQASDEDDNWCSDSESEKKKKEKKSNLGAQEMQQDKKENELPDDFFEIEESQDIYAMNCLIVLPKKW